MRTETGWRSTLLLREAWRNVFAARSPLKSHLAVALVASWLLVAMLALQWHDFQNQLDDLDAQGRNVLVISAAKPGAVAAIGRSSCEALVRVPGVARAGLFEEQGRVSLPYIGDHLPQFAVSSTLVPEVGEHDVVIGSALGLSAGAANVLLPSGAVANALVGAPQPAGIDINSGVTTSLSPTVTAASRCLVVLEPLQDARIDGPRLSAMLEVTGAEIAARPVLAESVDVVALYRDRPERWLPGLFGLISGVFGLFLARLRVSDRAAYLLGGTSRFALWQLLVLEQVIIAGTYVLGAAGAAAALAPMLPSPVVALAWTTCSGLLWVMISCGAFLVVFGDPSSMAKER